MAKQSEECLLEHGMYSRACMSGVEWKGVRGGGVGAQVERNLHDAMGVARNVVRDPRLVPGGGAVEMALSRHLSERSAAVQVCLVSGFALHDLVHPELVHVMHNGLQSSSMPWNPHSSRNPNSC